MGYLHRFSPSTLAQVQCSTSLSRSWRVPVSDFGEAFGVSSTEQPWHGMDSNVGSFVVILTLRFQRLVRRASQYRRDMRPGHAEGNVA